MTTSDNWEVEWIVAVLAPWTVSPHPNFRGASVTGAAALGLVTEMRDGKEGCNVQSQASTISDWKERLIANARQSLSAETQMGSVDELLRLSESHEVPAGARAASLLFASVALCELERHSEAVDAIEHLIHEFDGALSDGSDCLASQRLIVAALRMQLSARLVESCRFREAQFSVEDTIRSLPGLRESSFQNFAVSAGIGWGPSTVQRDIIRSIKNHALSLKSLLEQIGGHTWARVVRGRSSWVDMRMNLRSSERDEIVLRDAFENRIEADSNAQHFGRLSAEGAGYRSLIVAELSGYIGLMFRERESLGKVLILERGDDPERVREALRLLRQGQATKSLQAAITWIRAQGPSSSLVDDALTVISRINSARWCNEQDLLVLEGASDFLSSHEKDAAISAALVFAKTPRLQGRMSWSSWERLWKTVIKLTPASGRDNDIAVSALRYVRDNDALSQPIANTLARLVSSLDWTEVEAGVLSEWSAFADAIQDDFDSKVLLDSISSNVRNLVRNVPPELGVERAAYFADEGIPDGDDGTSVPGLARHLEVLLREEVDDARQGTMTLRAYQTCNVAVAFALRFPNANLWRAIVGHILDGDVDASLKNLAVERLAENVLQLPVQVSTQLRDDIHQLINSKRREGMFMLNESSVFGAAIRLSAALAATSKSQLLETLLRLAAAGVKDRIQAAKTIPFVISEGDATWGHVLLLQLSNDSDPSVRAAAGASLVRSLLVVSEVTDSVYSRIVELLKSDGIKVPLAVLHSLQRNVLVDGFRLEPLIPQIKALTRSDGNFLTQGAARIVLERLVASEL